MSSSTWASASGPPTSGLSAFLILPGDAAQCAQSVCESPDSTWKPAVEAPQRNPFGKSTSAGGPEGPPPDEWHATPSVTARIRTASALPDPDLRPRRPPGPSRRPAPTMASILHRSMAGRCAPPPLQAAPGAAPMGLLDGKVAIVTGAGGGIGRAHARLLAREGAKVVVNDVGGSREGAGHDASPANQVVEEITKAGGVAVSNHDSVSTTAGAAAIVKSGVDAFGRVDVLVNNAGILRDKSFLKLDEAMWDSVISVHLKGTFLCSQAFAKQVVQQNLQSGGSSGGGRIVNTTSVSGMLGNFGQANYAAAKAGIYGLTRTMSIELQKHRITVNAIAPIAKTRMTEDLPMFQGVDTLTAEHIAPAALFLGSDLCADRTGHVLAIAGARVYAFKVVETTGRFKEADNGVWTAREIAESWDAIVKV